MSISDQIINWDANATYGFLTSHNEQDGSSITNPYRSYVGLNPSSLHSGGQRSRAMIENVRAKILTRVKASASGSLVFTSGATEANNLVLWSWALRNNFRCRIIIPASEHASIIEPAKIISTLGSRLELITPKRGGLLSVDKFIDAISRGPDNWPVLVCCMMANNETGQIYPIAELAHSLRQLNPELWFHTDAVQTFNKLEIDFNELGVNSLAFSGHKLGALPGVGGVIYRKQDELRGITVGGAQEGRVRAGTENWMAINSLDTAIEKKDWYMAAQAKEKLKNLLSASIPEVQFNFESSKPELVLPNTLSVTIPGVIADDLVVSADLNGVMISAGAACASGKPEPSHVLLSAGLSEQEARETVRISFRADVSVNQIERGADILINCIKRMRSETLSLGANS